MRNGRAVLFSCVVVVVETLVGGAAEARDFRSAMIPNGFEFPCSSCHIDPGGGGRRTPFGEQVRQRVTPNGTEEFWDAALAALDADRDGRTNGEELGDPDGRW